MRAGAASWALGRARTRFAGARLRLSGDADRRAIGAALGRRLSAAERQALAPVEAERRRLEASDALLRTPLRTYTLDPDDEHVFEDTLGELAARASKPREGAELLFALVRRLRPLRGLELGTAFGISAAYQGVALRLNGGGRLVTMDASAERVEVARGVLSRLGLDGVVEARLGRFQDLLPEVLREPVGYAFVDGQHEEQATLDYLDAIHPALTAPGLVVFDDIRWSDGMARAWARLRADGRVRTSAEALGMGVCLYHLPSAAR